jgi:hypothetical protein
MLRVSEFSTAERLMIHWKFKLVHLAVFALVLLSAVLGCTCGGWGKYGCAW